MRMAILDEANIVCSTLSFAGSSAFTRMTRKWVRAAQCDSSRAPDVLRAPSAWLPPTQPRPSLRVVAHRFDVVVIDEAAQAVEPATLVPIINGCKQVCARGRACVLLVQPCGVM